MELVRWGRALEPELAEAREPAANVVRVPEKQAGIVEAADKVGDNRGQAAEMLQVGGWEKQLTSIELYKANILVSNADNPGTVRLKADGKGCPKECGCNGNYEKKYFAKPI